MFYKVYPSGAYKLVDLQDSQVGAVFLLCPGPSLAHENLDLLNQPGIVTLGMNSSILHYRSHYWITQDWPTNHRGDPSFPRALYRDPNTLKFMKMNCYNQEVDPGRQMMDYPNTLFYRLDESYREDDLLRPGDTLVWWHNTFFAALQLAYRLGFRRIYLLGVDLKIQNPDQPYSHDQRLSMEALDRNQRLYRDTIRKMDRLKPHFWEKDLEIWRTNPESGLQAYPHIPLLEAVTLETGKLSATGFASAS